MSDAETHLSTHRPHLTSISKQYYFMTSDRFPVLVRSRLSLKTGPAGAGNGVRDVLSRTPLPSMLKSILDIVLYLLKTI